MPAEADAFEPSFLEIPSVRIYIEKSIEERNVGAALAVIAVGAVGEVVVFVAVWSGRGDAFAVDSGIRLTTSAAFFGRHCASLVITTRAAEV